MKKELASAKRRKLATEVKMDIIRTGFLPTLSDILPNMGEKMNCINENEAIKIPRAADPAWKVSAKNGRRGIIIPNPVASMKSVITITRIGENPNLACLEFLRSVFSLICSFSLSIRSYESDTVFL